MKQKITLFLLIMIALSTSARDHEDLFWSDNRSINELFKQSLAADLEHRNDKLQVLNTKQMLTSDTEQLWTDGRFIFSTMYDPDTKMIGAGYNRYMEPTTTMVMPHEMKMVGNKMKVTGKTPLYVTVEKLGQYTLLVYRNAQGTPVRAYFSITNDMRNNGDWTIFLHYILAGNYKLANGKYSVFGPKQDFYEGDRYNCDPGLYQFYIYPDKNLIDIVYGEGRVSGGDPSDPRYGKMPGGGGAAAIMGPMTWQVMLTNEGLDATVLHDEPFVDHNPRLAKGNNVLTKVQCPWEGVDGKWAFASVIPLTHELLKLFPKETLELMRAEIYARHGDTFKSAANQKYFDQQPWYKKSGKPVVLTDIEKFNIALIKQVMATIK
ncbi:MAG: YARHG domain-containing protein [Muribaculaceae bacterium]|nr:YARHG domain-containing protein [Muribaculaceae bacterium]